MLEVLRWVLVLGIVGFVFMAVLWLTWWADDYRTRNDRDAYGGED